MKCNAASSPKASYTAVAYLFTMHVMSGKQAVGKALYTQQLVDGVACFNSNMAKCVKHLRMDHQQVTCCGTGASCAMPACCLLLLTLGPTPLGTPRATPERPVLCNVLCGELRRLLLRHLCIWYDSQGSGACNSICRSRVPVCLVLDPLTSCQTVCVFRFLV